MATSTRPWDVCDHLDTPEAVAAYIDAVLEDGDPKLVAAAIGDVARAKSMSQLARDTGLSRESLYKALSADGNPEFATVMKVLRALGMRVAVVPADEDEGRAGERRAHADTAGA